MAQKLRQSTRTTVILGPLIDDTDQITRKTEVAYDAVGIDVDVHKHGGAKTDVTLSDEAGDGYWRHQANGIYSLTLPATALDTLGHLRVTWYANGVLTGWEDFEVVTSNVYDSEVAGTDRLQVDTQEIAASIVTGIRSGLATGTDLATVDGTVGVIAADVAGLNGASIPTVEQVQSGLATSADLEAVAEDVTTLGTAVTSVLARLGEWTGSGINTILGAITAMTSRDAETPSDIGGTYDPATDSLEALSGGIASLGGSTGGGGGGSLPTTIVSVADFKTWVALRGRDLGEISDALILVALTNAVSIVEDMCNRKIEPDAEAIEVNLPGTGSEYLLIPESLEVESVSVGEDEWDEGVDYDLVPELDRPVYALKRHVSGALWDTSATYTLELIRGYRTPVPASLTEAAYRIAEGRTVAAPDEGIKSVSVQGVSVSLVSEAYAEDVLESLIAPHVRVI